MQKVIILSGPSGVGKNTLGDFLLQQFPELSYSVSATSRSIRKGEQDGVDYHFMNNEEFEQKIKEDALLEWQEVYDGMYYGTMKSELDRINSLNKFPLLVVDVFGAINVMKNLKFKPLSIFIQAPSLEILENRLRTRGTDSEEKIAKRLEKASVEMNESANFDLTIINDDLPMAQKQLEEVVHYFLKFGF
ncbi:MAG: guanylate kinase [Chitinophagales bacterium]|nr:guanylate kinase [Chitinophagales bacterium]HMV14974.1 guanylate kinase [Chitinophagales bacterium]HMW12565.1 guanylate kinase [Chitinophagales bacterium]HMX59829.1 guanylate kinase [Chitinophagales bacterium]HMY22854.1 guanylate kinase [Chitinophagales bacterium]